MLKVLMNRHFVAFSLAAFVSASGFVHGQEKSNPSKDSKPLLKRCSKENRPPCIDKAPIPILAPNPSCTTDAEHVKTKGKAAFQAVVGTGGVPRDISIVKPIGHGLDEEVVKAATNWRFKPGESSGKPTPSLIYVQVDISCPLGY